MRKNSVDDSGLEPRHRLLTGILPFAGIALLALLTYGRVATFPFFGDDYYIVQPLHGWRFLGMSVSHPSYWRPLWSLWVSLQYELFGPSARAMHVTNLILHFVNGSLVFIILARAGVSRAVALGTVALWFVMVGNANAVAWISACCDLVALTFLLAATYLWVFTPAGQGPSMVRSAAASVCWFLAMLSKEIGFAWPVAALAFSVVRSRRLRRTRRVSAGEVAATLLPLVALASYVGLRFIAYGGTGGFSASDREGHLVGSGPAVVAVGRVIHLSEALLYNFLPLDNFPSWRSLCWGTLIGGAFAATLMLAGRGAPEADRRPRLLAICWGVLFSLHGAMSPLPRTLYTATLGAAFFICSSVSADALFQRSQWAFLLFAGYLGMHVYLGQHVLDEFSPSNFASSVTGSRMLLEDDALITPDMKATLREQLRYEDVNKLSSVTVDDEPPWRKFLQHVFQKLFRKLGNSRRQAPAVHLLGLDGRRPLAPAPKA